MDELPPSPNTNGNAPSNTQTPWSSSGGGDAPERTWAMLCHLSALIMFVFPLGNIVGPLVIWMAKRDDDTGVREHGRASLNFQLSMSLYFVALVCALIAVIFGFGVAAIGGVASGGPGGAAGAVGSAVVGLVLVIGIAFVLGLTGLANIALIIVNSIRAYDGKTPVYPLAIPFFRK